jgi:hypothetical protein
LNDAQVSEAAADLIASGKLIPVRTGVGSAGFAFCFLYELGRMDRNWALTFLRHSKLNFWTQVSLRSIVGNRLVPLTKLNDEQVLLGGTGRPQALINDELRTCDFVFLLLWDRWGTPPQPTGTGSYTSGTEEEFRVANGTAGQAYTGERWPYSVRAINAA